MKFESISCDGHCALLQAIRVVCPVIILQRCKFYVQRICRIWFSIKPKSLAGQKLRTIVFRIHLIKGKTELSYGLLELASWDKKYHEYTHYKTANSLTGKYWYTHKLLRRSFSVLLTSLPHLFEYL